MDTTKKASTQAVANTMTDAQHREFAAFLNPVWGYYLEATNRKSKQAFHLTIRKQVRAAEKRGYSANLIWTYIGEETA